MAQASISNLLDLTVPCPCGCDARVMRPMEFRDGHWYLLPLVDFQEQLRHIQQNPHQ